LRSATTVEGSGANPHRNGAFAAFNLSRGVALLSLLAMLMPAAGCVSSVDPVLGSAASASAEQPASEIPLDVAGSALAAADAAAQPVSPAQQAAPPSPSLQSDAAAPGASPAPQATATVPAVQAADAKAATQAPGAPGDLQPAGTAGAIPIPVPAPRPAGAQGAGGAELAFAEPPATPVADAATLAANAGTPAPDPAQTAAALSTSNAPVDETRLMASTLPQDASANLKPVKKPASLFEFLKQRKEQREAALQPKRAPETLPEPQAPAATVAAPAAGDAETQTAAAPSQAERSAAPALPGVQSNKELFGIGSEEEEEDLPYEVASAAGLARLSPTGILKQTDKVDVGCFGNDLITLLKRIEAHYSKPVLVTSGYRNPGANRRAGGARHSMHIQCKAADIQIEGVSKWDLAKYLRSVAGRGGVGTYCRTNSVHIDTGPERDWHYPCRRAKKKRA
jgi:uncharacterized protein YcbK (DUF882 family)